MPSLLEYQRQFMAALFARGDASIAAAIAGNGLEPAARLRIYRHMVEATYADALRTTYPATLALVGAAFFEQCAQRFGATHPARSGNLQDYGDGFAAFLEGLPQTRGLPYLGDVARLEWLRQEAALAADAPALPAGAIAAIVQQPAAALALHPSVRLLPSRHAVLTVFRYAMEPDDAGLRLPATGEQVLLWRDGDGIAMTALDAASFACIAALARGCSLAVAANDARALDPEFELGACMRSFGAHGLIVAGEDSSRAC